MLGVSLYFAHSPPRVLYISLEYHIAKKFDPTFIFDWNLILSMFWLQQSNVFIIN